jgi:hypothetical protein
VKIKTISKQVVDAHKERLNSGKHGVCVSAGEIKQMLSLATPQQI